ncbi:MAG: hypothetical protein AAFU33_21940 [Bacteroidota bacterium]
MKEFMLFFGALLLGSLSICAQGRLVNNGAQVKATGNVQIVLQNTSWINNNGQFTPGTSTVKFTGTTEDSIKGPANQFYRMVMEKSSGNVKLADSLSVIDTLYFVTGNVDLDGNNLYLGTATGGLANESETSRIQGANGGQIIKVLALNAPNNINPGNLGATITSAQNMGATTIARGHQPQILPDGSSINRYYVITPTNNANLGATVTYGYFDAELNGVTESALEAWNFDGINWVNQAPDATDAAANFVQVTVNELGRITLGAGAIKIALKAYLEGAYNTGTGQMNDGLRAADLLPDTEPYTGLAYTQINSGGEKVDTTIFDLTGSDAVVDWIFLELRDKNDSSIVLRTANALIQADGDIVGLDGKSAVSFAGMPEDDYFLTIKHRNHLGIRSPGAITLSRIETSYDFTSALSQAWDNPSIITNDAMVDLGGGVYGLFRGNANSDQVLNIVDLLIARSNSNPNQAAVYDQGDNNLDGNINIVDFFIGRAATNPNKTGHN